MHASNGSTLNKDEGLLACNPSTLGKNQHEGSHACEGSPLGRAETYSRDARKDEKAEQKAQAWDLWLDCLSTRDVGKAVGVNHDTVATWVSEIGNDPVFRQPPESRQHFDVWNFATAADDAQDLGPRRERIGGCHPSLLR